MTYKERRDVEFGRLMDAYEKEHGTLPNATDAAIMMREAAERAHKVLDTGAAGAGNVKDAQGA